MLKFYLNNDNFNWALVRQILSLSLFIKKPVQISGAMCHITKNQLLPLYDDLKRLIHKINAGSLIDEMDTIIYHPENIEYGVLHYESAKHSSMMEIALFLYPSLFYKEFRSVLCLNGVTHSHLSYPTIYLKNNILSLLERVNYIGSLTLKRFGFHGTGGGDAELRIYPFKNEKKKVSFIPDKLKIVGARVLISGLNTDIAKNEKKYLMDGLNLQENKVAILEVRDSDGPGNSIQVFISEGENFDSPLVLHCSFRVVDDNGNIVLNNDQINHGLEQLLQKSISCVKENKYPDDLVQEILPYCIMSKTKVEYNSNNSLLSKAEEIFREFIL